MSPLRKVKNLGDNETKFINAAHSAFNLVFSKCKNSDVIKPENFQCINNSGFSSSIVESLEALFILGLRGDYVKAKKYSLERFNCEELEWVRTREFWSRGIGSLIGAYLVTKEMIFIETAKKCTLRALEISQINHQYDYINLKELKGKNDIWANGTVAGDMFAGLPEILAIGHLTKDGTLLDIPKYINFEEHIRVNNLPSVYNFTTKRMIMESDQIDGFNVDLLHRLVIAYSIYSIPSIGDVLRRVLSKMVFPKSYMPEIYYPLLSVSNLLNDVGFSHSMSILDDLANHAESNLIDRKLDDINVSNKNHGLRISFEMEGMRYLMKSALKEKNETKLSSLHSSLLIPIVQGQIDQGIVGIISSKGNTTLKSSIMPSNLFGQWFNQGALYYAKLQDIITKGIFNDRGHLIMCDSIFPFSRT